MPSPRVPNDDGSVDPGLAAALRAHDAEPARLPQVLAALHRARVLAPIVALLQETGTSPAGLRVEKTSDIALPLLLDADGRKAVLVFSSLDTLHRWDRSARPVPVTG
ncbi:MAG: SseB family protein, partial [Spirochaetaceae bacterium]|nr:SseB family protein [Spirochaetaceae bacterium]